MYDNVPLLYKSLELIAWESFYRKTKQFALYCLN